MQVGLFIPIYIDHFYPQVGMATVELLEQFSCEAEFPDRQTCCGQPMENTGCTNDTRPLAEKFFQIFRKYEYVVCPSGFCVSMVRNYYEEYLAGRDSFKELKAKTFGLCEHHVARNSQVLDLAAPYRGHPKQPISISRWSLVLMDAVPCSFISLTRKLFMQSS